MAKVLPTAIAFDETLAELEAEATALRAQVAALTRDSEAERTAAEGQLAFALDWMRLAQEAGGVSAYALNLKTQELSWSASNLALWGWGPDDNKPDVVRWLQTIHPDDRAEAEAFLATKFSKVGEVRHDFRIVMPDGEVRYIEDRARVFGDEAGRPERIVGLNIDLSALRRAEATLRETEERLRKIFEQAAVGMAQVGLDGRFLLVNRRLCEILGYSEEKLLTLSFQEITHPRDLERDLAQVRALLAGEIERFHMEKRYVRETGEVVWAELSASLLRDAEGQPLAFISAVADISQRKRVEQRLNFVLGELAHRSRNLLAVVLSSVRRLAAEAPDVETFAAGLTRQIEGMAAAEGALARSDFAPTPIEDLIMGQLTGVLAPDDRRLRLEGPPLLVDAAAAQTLGLALHELATNACKHGALSSGRGRVTIAWTLAAPDRFMMTWTERGGPQVDAPSRHGFGRRIIEEIIASSLGGEVDLRFETEGVVWRLDAPATCVAPARPHSCV